MFSTKRATPSLEVSKPRFQIRQKRERRKVPYSGSHAIGALERKYQETAGQIKQLDEALYEWEGRAGWALANQYEIELRARLRASLVSLENAIRLLQPKWDRKSLMVPMVKRHTRPLFVRTKFQTALVAFLRLATEPMIISQIVEKLAPGLGLPNPSADQRRRLRSMAYSSLRGYYDKGLVDCVGKPPKWFARSNQ